MIPFVDIFKSTANESIEKELLKSSQRRNQGKLPRRGGFWAESWQRGKTYFRWRGWVFQAGGTACDMA